MRNGCRPSLTYSTMRNTSKSFYSDLTEVGASLRRIALTDRPTRRNERAGAPPARGWQRKVDGKTTCKTMCKTTHPNRHKSKRRYKGALRTKEHSDFRSRPERRRGTTHRETRCSIRTCRGDACESGTWGYCVCTAILRPDHRLLTAGDSAKQPTFSHDGCLKHVSDTKTYSLSQQDDGKKAR
jgi:hypothetical protein